MDMTRLLNRVRQLANMPMSDLRTEYAIAQGLTTSSRWDDQRVASGLTRGELMSAIIEAEFEESSSD